MKRKKIILFCALCLIVIISVLFRKIIAEIAGVFVSGLIIAYLLLPLVKRLEKRFNRTVSILFTYFFALAALSVFLVLTVPIIKNEIKNILVALPGYFNALNGYIQRLQAKLPFLRGVLSTESIYNGISSFLTLKVSGAFSHSSVSMAETLLLAPFVSYYLLKERETLFKNALFIVPEKIREQTKALLFDVNRLLRDYVSGELIIILLVSLLTAVSLLLCGFNNWLVLGIFMGIMNVIPYLGPVLGSVPIIASALAVSLNRAWLGLIIIIFVQQLDNLIIQPRVISESVRIHPLTVMLCILAGGSFSFFGMLLAIPVYIVLRIFLKAFYANFTERKLKFSAFYKI